MTASSNVLRMHKEFLSALRRAAGREPLIRRVVGHPEPVKAYGIRVSRMRDIFKSRVTEVATLDLQERLALAKLLLQSHVEEEGHIGLGVLRMSVSELTPTHFSKIDEMLDDFCTWTEVDDFASGKGSITATLLARYPMETLRLHGKWVKSSNMWKRRTSVVTFTRKTAVDGDYIDEALAWCEALMWDHEDLVQKAVGWALKDAMRAGPAAKRRVLALVKRMRRAGVPSTITLYAIRDLKGAEREAILKAKPTKG